MAQLTCRRIIRRRVLQPEALAHVFERLVQICARRAAHALATTRFAALRGAFHQLRAHLSDRIVENCGSAVFELLALAFECGSLVHQLLLEPAGLRAQRFEFELALLQLGALRGQTLEGALQTAAFFSEQRFRAGDHGRRQPQCARERKRERLARNAKCEDVGRRVGVSVEKHGCVRDALGGCREDLQLRIVRRDDDARADRQERFDERLRERGAGDGLGTAADLVDQH